MVKMLTNLFNKRKREIIRLNGVVNELQHHLKKCNSFASNSHAEKLEVERHLRERNAEVLSLKNEVDYLKMRIENTKGETNTRYY
jgi:hypothetical protein